MNAARMQWQRAVNFEAAGKPMIEVLRTFLKGYKGWVSLGRITDRFDATPYDYVKRELDKAVEQRLLLRESRPSGVHFYKVRPTEEERLESEAEAQLARRSETVAKIAKRFLDKTFDNSANLGLRYALESAYEQGWQDRGKKS